MKWFVVAGSLIIVSTLLFTSLLDRRDKKRARIYYTTIDVKNGKIEPFKNHF